MRRLDVAVAGAGPAGLAVALYLRHAGHRVTIFERFERPHPVGSGLMLQPTGQAVLADLGLLDRVLKLGQRLDRLSGTDSRSGRTVLDVRYENLSADSFGLGIHRAALFDTLFGAVRAALIDLVGGYGVTGIDIAGSKAWLIAGSRREGPFDLVVDALGSSSTLREQSLRSGRSRRLAYGAIWATVPWLANGFDKCALQQRYRQSSVMIGVMPVGRQAEDGPELGTFFWSLKPTDYDGLKAKGIDAWKGEVFGHWPETRLLLEPVASFEQMTLARYTHHTMGPPVAEALAFVGDSAHATSPQLGQGANMALLDAKALAVALAHEPTIADALQSYARMRRWHVRLYQMMSLTLTPMYQSDSRVLPWLRDAMVSTLGRVPPMPRVLAAMVAGGLLNPLKPLGIAGPL
jgi:2-polyprenyl-6-methoxyphenol hydroxylase-like FAD-dependent oxidoreductase